MHTKRKWRYEKLRQRRGENPINEYGIYDSDDKEVAIVKDVGVFEANAKLIAATPDMADASKDFLDGWLYFCDCIDFAKSALDADAIRFMNEVPGKIEAAYKAATA